MSWTRPHVLMTADAVGGVWRYALDLSRGLGARGVRVTLAVTGPDPTTAQAAEAAGAPGLEVIATRLALDWTASSPAVVEAAGAALAALAAEVGADLVHLNSPAYAAAAPMPVPTLGVAHSCVATWWRAVEGEAPWPDDFGWRAALTAGGYAACDALVAPSRAFAEATGAAYGIAPPRVVRNGRRRIEAAALGPPGPFVFAAGRLWDRGKNIALLDAAAQGLSVYAAGPLTAPHGETARLDHIRPLGVLDEAAVAGWCAARPVFVSAAVYEPFGLAVLEAAQAGCPLVLSDIPTFRELWDGAALFVSPQDPGALAETLRGLMADPDRRTALGAVARVRAGAYSAEAMTDGVLDLYAGLAPAVFAREAVA